MPLGTLELINRSSASGSCIGMSRQARHPVDDGIYHVLNRDNCRMDIFEKSGDFQSFIKLLEQGRQRCSSSLHLSIARDRPLGDDSWTAQVAKR